MNELKKELEGFRDELDELKRTANGLRRAEIINLLSTALGCLSLLDGNFSPQNAEVAESSIEALRERIADLIADPKSAGYHDRVAPLRAG